MSEITIYLLINMLRACINQRFIRIFFDREETDKWKELVSFCFFYIITSGGYVLCQNLGINILTNLLGLFIMALIYKGSWKKKILISFLIYSICIAIDVVVKLILVSYETGSSVKVHEIISVMVQLIGQIILEKTMKFRKAPSTIVPQWIYLLMLPIFSIGMIYYLAINQLFFDASIIFVGICFMFNNAISFFLYSSIEEMYAKNMEYKIFEQKSREYSHQLDIIMQTQEQVRSLQHDMKNHIRELTALAMNKQSEDVVVYLNKMEGFAKNPNEFVCSGNIKVDSNLNFLLNMAHKVLTSVEIEIKIPENMESLSFELNVILGNLLENAIEAASRTKEKMLCIYIEQHMGILFIMVKNSYDGKIKDVNGVLKTIKKEENHGYGLRNIKYIIDKNRGEMTINHTEHEFQVDIFLYSD